ncbi:uncharacterized protein LOC109838413 [Asparagus officinalis]|uniref:uncharacterized protein LOC109838413 n=1 Tax=Asparagus officinalis TaxID=4686 RepID=UPI00098E745D|nr:uncharacterized protein LOC109838413 [Asparagus officinalis]
MNSFEDFASNLSVDDIEAFDDEDDLIEALLLNDDDEDEYMWNEMLNSVIHQSIVIKQVPRPYRTRPFSGHMLVEDMLAGHPEYSYSCFRMSSETILLLKNVLIEKNALRLTRYLSCNEQLCIFLYRISHALSNRKALGAIDGSHIPIIVKKKKHNRYHNRKNFIS